MARYNTSAILTAAHAKAATIVKDRELHYTWALRLSYRQIFAKCLSDAWSVAIKAAQPVEHFVVRLEYSQVKLRDAIKKIGARWSPDTKVWTVSCKYNQLPVPDACIVQRGCVKQSVAVNSNAGYAGAYIQRPAYRMGAEYDGIEY